MLVTNAQITGQTVLRLPNSTTNEMCLTVGFFLLVLIIIPALSWTKVVGVISRQRRPHEEQVRVMPPVVMDAGISRSNVPLIVVEDTSETSEKYAPIIQLSGGA